MAGKYWIFCSTIIILAFSVPARAELPDTLVIALDGIPYSLVREAQANGEFKDFYPASKMISTFPSLSDVAFDDIFHCDTPLGYQRIHFSPEKNKVVGKFINELFKPEEYQLRFDSVENGKIHYVLLYIMSNAIGREEIAHMKRDFFVSNDADVFYAFIEASDPILHKYGRDDAMLLLDNLNRTIEDIETEYLARTGRHLKIVAFSDHGNTMVKGAPIPIKGFLKEHGYIPSNKPEGPNYVAWTASGIVSSAVFYTQPGTEARLANDLIKMDGVAFATYDESGVQFVLNNKGLAKIYYDPIRQRGRYEVVTGDPIDYSPVMEKAKASGWVDGDGYVPEAKLFSLTVDNEYPDAVWRIYFCFHGAVVHTASVVLSLNDGYEFANGTVKSLARLSHRMGTHGGLSQINSAGFMFSNFERTEDVSTNQAAMYFDTTEFVRKEHKGAVSRLATRYETIRSRYPQ